MAEFLCVFFIFLHLNYGSGILPLLRTDEIFLKFILIKAKNFIVNVIPAYAGISLITNS